MEHKKNKNQQPQQHNKLGTVEETMKILGAIYDAYKPPRYFEELEIDLTKQKIKDRFDMLAEINQDYFS